tara:strand:+ start:566 stop:1480 length:915 start_codon:yes stop_codon:yes gene_type:complete
MSAINKFFIGLTGEDLSILEQQSPISKKKIISQGSLLLIAPFVWFCVGFFISKNYFESDFIGSFFSGLICSIIVFIVERSILLSQANKAMAVFRILLAFIMSFLGGELINLEFFKEDIRIAKINQMVVFSNNQVDKYEKIYIQKQNDFTQEMNGNGSDKGVGYGRIAKKKEEIMNNAKAEWMEMRREKANLENNLNNESIVMEKGLLHDSKLLLDMASKDWYVLLFFIFWCLFVLFLEIIVVVNKMFSTDSSYDTKQIVFENLSKLEVQRLDKKIAKHLRNSDSQLALQEMLNKQNATFLKNNR